MSDQVKYEIGQIVYAKVKSDIVGQVTGILFRPHGVMYAITWASDQNEKWHYDIELTAEKNFQES